MGCSSANDTNTIDQNNESKTINIKFKLSSGEEYEIPGKENDLFKTVLTKFQLEHSEINNKIINALYQDNEIDLNKTLLQNNIKENYVIELDIQDPDSKSTEYNPENIIWIDENIDSEENSDYLDDLHTLGYNVKCFKNVDDGFKLVKTIKFESTKIIISGRLYIKFVKKFIDNLNSLYVIPKIIIFTRSKEGFIKNNKENEDLINHPFFNFGGIRVVIDDVISFLKDEIVQNRVKKEKVDANLFNNEFFDNRLKTKDNAKLTFEYIDNTQKLALPLFYNSLIDSIKIDDIEKYTEYIFSKYAGNSVKLKELLNPIKSMYDIPIELLCKYYARIYTVESGFYQDINNDLRENKTKGYLPYIKVLYEGVKLKSLNIASNIELYRGSKISFEEIDKIKGYLSKKIDNLPGAIVFSKAFLSFSKDREIAEKFVNNTANTDKNLCNVLYVLEKDKNIDYSLSTHTDIEKISVFDTEKEVLFFPFSPFEIKEMKEYEGEDLYEITLLYLGKYLKQIEKDVNIVEIENEIPDSEFKKQIIDLGLIKKDKIDNTKQIFNDFKQFQDKVKNNGYKKFAVKTAPKGLYQSFNDNQLEKNKDNDMAKSFNKNQTFVKNKLNQSQMLIKKNKSFKENFTITTMEEGDYKIKVVNINLPKFLGEYLIPIWFEKDKYIKFKTEGNYRINDVSPYHNSNGIPSTMKFNYGATIARIGSGEFFVLPSKEHIHFSKVEGPLYLKINFPKNMIIKPDGKLKIKIYDGELMSKEEIYEKIGWKEKNLKYEHSTSIENDLTVYLNNLRMNPVLFYESYIKDDNLNKTWGKDFLENMGTINDSEGIRPFSVNNNLYELIREFIILKYDNIKKKLTKKTSIIYMKELQELLEIYLKDKIPEDIVISCKLIKKSKVEHICTQYLYDKEFKSNIFNKDYNSIAIHIKDEFFDDFYLVILAITKIEDNDNDS